MPTETTPASKNRGKNGKNGQSGKGSNGSSMTPAAEPVSAQGSGVSQQQATSDDIARRAYELFEQEGRQDGKDVEYWLRAEAELTGRRT